MRNDFSQIKGVKEIHTDLSRNVCRVVTTPNVKLSEELQKIVKKGNRYVRDWSITQ